MWLLIPASLAATLDSVPNPRAESRWITDQAGVIADDAEARMEARIEALHQATDVEITVVTVDDVPGDPKGFATDLFNRWGVGDANANNGLLVLLVMGQRALEMETGYGLEPVLPDGWLGSMQASTMVPRFKEGDFGGGMEAGLTAIDATTAGLGVLGTSGAGALIVFLAARNRKKKWTCRKCGTRLEELDEDSDDAHLSEGQKTEEMVESVDWVVRVCPSCQEVHIFDDNKWFSGYDKCEKCGFKTSRSQRNTLRHASYTEGGLVEVTTNCVNCNHSTRRTYNTARLQRSSTGSSGGFSSSRSGGGFSGGSRGGSFGGGRSGGGGAGSRW